MIKFLLNFLGINSLIELVIWIANKIAKKTENKIDDFLVEQLKIGFQLQKTGTALKDIAVRLLIGIIKKLVELADNELDQRDEEEILNILKKKGLLK